MERRTALLAAGLGAAVIGAKIMLRHSRRMDLRGASVVITGGRGLALELARHYAAEGARITLLARDAGELDRARMDLQAHGADIFVHPCDVREREQVAEAVQSVIDRYGRINVLVNNAGVIQVGPVEHMRLEDFQDVVAVHLWGALHAMQQVIPHMRRQGGGRIVNIASIGGLVAIPHLVSYSTSKFALVGLSDGMRAELAKDGILVSTVCPGLMRTGSHVNAFFKGRNEKEYAWFSLSNAFPLFSTTTRYAARRIVDASRYGDPRVIIGVPAKMLHLADAIAPSLWASMSKMAARLLPQPDGRSGDRLHTGWESRSPLAPAALTYPADQAIPVNNELQGHRS